VSGGHYWDWELDRPLTGPLPDEDLRPSKPRRTKWSFPYSYDPFTVWGEPFPNAACNGSVYVDRLEEWDHKKFARLIEEVRVGEPHGRLFGEGCRGDLVQKFLRRWHDKPNLRLLRVIEYCNVATGYPTWRLDYVDCE